MHNSLAPLRKKPMVEVELMFGRNIGGKLGVTNARWAAFLAREVTPRFSRWADRVRYIGPVA